MQHFFQDKSSVKIFSRFVVYVTIYKFLFLHSSIKHDKDDPAIESKSLVFNKNYIISLGVSFSTFYRIFF